MPDDLILPENLSKEALKEIFDNAFMETSFDKDGDLRVRDGNSCFVFPREDRIRLLSVWGFKPETPAQKRQEFVEQVNKEFIMVRATVGPKDILFFDYDISIRGGILKKMLVLTTKRFLSIARGAVQEYGSEIVE